MIAAIRIALFAGLAMLAIPAAAQRIEVPIKAVTMTSGAPRYTVDLQINGHPIEAALDTGSTGLRVLAASVPDARGGGDAVRYRFNAGVELAGSAVKVMLGIGTLPAGQARVARIDTVKCVQRLPDCPAEGADPAAFRIMSDGIPGQGFVAIIGIGMRHDVVENPLVQPGIKRWIVDLPRPGATAPGRLILNPDNAEVARYRQFDMLPNTNMIAGCVTAADKKVCAPALLDSGSAGIKIRGGTDSDIIAPRTPATISIGDAKQTASITVEIGRRDQLTMMRLYPPGTPGERLLSLGVAPYLRWSILYDFPGHRVGVADRSN